MNSYGHFALLLFRIFAAFKSKNISTMSKAYKEVKRKVMKYKVYMYNYTVHNSMISSTGQWSEPKMSVCMLADVTDGMMRFEHKK